MYLVSRIDSTTGGQVTRSGAYTAGSIQQAARLCHWSESTRRSDSPPSECLVDSLVTSTLVSI